MPYSTAEEIQGDFKGMTFTDNANAMVKLATVTGFISEADALINAYVGKVYVVPVANTGDGLSLLKMLSRSLVAARVKAILEVKQATSQDANQNVRSLLLSPSEVMKILKDIRDRNIALAGAELISGADKGGFFNHNVSIGVAPVVRKDRKQW